MWCFRCPGRYLLYPANNLCDRSSAAFFGKFAVRPDKSAFHQTGIETPALSSQYPLQPKGNGDETK